MADQKQQHIMSPAPFSSDPPPPPPSSLFRRIICWPFPRNCAFPRQQGGKAHHILEDNIFTIPRHDLEKNFMKSSFRQLISTY